MLKLCCDCEYEKIKKLEEPCKTCMRGKDHCGKWEPKESEGKEMKTYKLEEIVKMVRENPKLKIESNISGDGYCEQRFSQGFLNADYRIVQVAVTFMEAVKAYKENDKTIECQLRGATYIYKCEGSELIDENDHTVSADEILNGKWFIE